MRPVFVWIRTRGALTPVQPQRVNDPSVGPKLEIVEEHPLKAHHYDWSLDDLIQIHPAPEVTPE